MKTKSQRSAVFTALLAASMLAASHPARATNYAGNGNGSFGGNIGTGTLSVTDDGTNLTFTLVPNHGNLGGNGLALYLDTGTGGFASTSAFKDAGDGGRSVVSGYSGSGQSVMTFTNGFSPAYAISFGDGFTGLFQLANGGNNSFNYITGVGSPNSYSFTFPAADLGLTHGVTATLRIFGSFISTSGYRSSEAIAGNDYTAFSPGWNPYTQTAYGTYTFAAPVVPKYPVRFSVDMTAAIALGSFNPANGDTVYASGTFQTNVWTGFQLTNNPTLSDNAANIYSGTYLDFNPTNTTEYFKFEYHSISGNNNPYESQDNRPFTLKAPGVTNALVYFDDVYPSPSATTNYLTFSIDLTPQIELGHFNPDNGDQIEVLGTFESPKWTTSLSVVLTNNASLSGNAANIYSGTIADGNYPGSFENYKFVMAQSGNNYESGNNRDFFTPTNNDTVPFVFPLAYFNGVVSAYSTPVTFSVDMSAPVFLGTFNPAAGDSVYAAGSFQTNAWDITAFVLTNDLTAANTNLYSGTYVTPDAPGTGEQYLFMTVNGSNSKTNYESLPNRTFILPATATNLPLALWSNYRLDTNNYLLEPTTVTFTVDMANAVDKFGYLFHISSDYVIINGNFTSPQWPNFWADAQLGADGPDYAQNVMYEVGDTTLFTNSFTVAANSSLEVQYKYGIIHNYDGASNTNADNEAGPNLNHTRYIRAVGTYDFPVDTFGMQQTNLPAATEPSFGSLAIAAPVAGHLPLSWLGRPGVYLQYTTNLAKGPWVQLNATDGANAASWPQTNGAVFFRLVNP